jgi:hypothetical protein
MDLKTKFRNLFKASKTCGEISKVGFIVSVTVALVGYGLAIAADHVQGQMRNNRH